jgi:hypothetical protein
VARRLTGEILRLLQPVERVLSVRVPGLGGAPAQPEPAEPATSSSPEDAAARIDAARARLRATIDPPADDKN